MDRTLPGTSQVQFASQPKRCTIASRFRMVYAEYDWVEDTCVFVDIEFGQPTSAKMLLNILHNIHTDDCFSASLADTRGIFELAKILGLDHTILRFWFSIWLTNQDLDFIEPHILEEFRTFGQKVGHPMGDAYLDMLIKGDQAISKAIIAFPPVFTKSYRQKSATTSLGRTINPNEYESLGFSPAFMRHFGLPVDYWSDYKRLMTTPFHAELVPKIKTWEKLNQYNFLRFAGTVDEKCSRFHSDLGPVWGDHMEAGWAQMIMDIYINDVLPSAQMSEPSFREQAHHELRMNFRKVGKLLSPFIFHDYRLRCRELSLTRRFLLVGSRRWENLVARNSSSRRQSVVVTNCRYTCSWHDRIQIAR
ncbi:hypothetical protein BKA64DRAFT_13689 [Cadophora sp. MPI-SDFR-AT-0126]|nr:hypothetical protein BKA64DRAFT_13689 [Leotiomycetes sp. MPI-SDFR-AT-0126]